VSRIRRRQYPKHSGDPYDRFLTERSRGEDGEFSFAKFVELVEALDCPADTIPKEGNNGTRRMTAGIVLRSWFADGVLRFKDGTSVQLDLDEESKQ
jgi:hypothetical protein